MRIVYMKISTDGGEVYLGIIFVYMKIREGGPPSSPRKALTMHMYDSFQVSKLKLLILTG